MRESIPAITFTSIPQNKQQPDNNKEQQKEKLFRLLSGCDGLSRFSTTCRTPSYRQTGCFSSGNRWSSDPHLPELER